MCSESLAGCRKTLDSVWKETNLPKSTKQMHAQRQTHMKMKSGVRSVDPSSGKCQAHFTA